MYKTEIVPKTVTHCFYWILIILPHFTAKNSPDKVDKKTNYY